jgi:hypothetical protein
MAVRSMIVGKTRRQVVDKLRSLQVELGVDRLVALALAGDLFLDKAIQALQVLLEGVFGELE